MDKDHASIIAILASLALLIATGNGVWLAVVFMACIFGGWQFGKRIIPVEEA